MGRVLQQQTPHLYGASSNDLGVLTTLRKLTVCTVNFKQYESVVAYESVDVRRNVHENKRRLADMVAGMGADEKETYKSLGELGNGRNCKIIKKLSHAEEELVWKIRHGLVNIPSYLPAFALATSWDISESVSTTYRMLGQWALPSVD